ncbi:MarR family winged helix-turn-helix transcriptional regulator [Mycolicibacterium smegmatis]|uniref:MarR family winged helix-turn-helix transcriptional regulator n=1 Tax=Mycolicibacterium smegmatis TaxID=1772 RepID=UPI00130377BF|nr:MarR family transcriptional regulator [Mycolicibacterium smegmatis]
MNNLAVTLTRAARVLAADLDALLKPSGLATDHWLVLQTLHDENGLTMTEMVERTGTNAATLTRVVDKLISKSFAYREVDGADRRKIRVYLSTRGKSFHRRTAGAVAEHEQTLIDRGDLEFAFAPATGPVS